jgi:hypothetical protein
VQGSTLRSRSESTENTLAMRSLGFSFYFSSIADSVLESLSPPPLRSLAPPETCRPLAIDQFLQVLRVPSSLHRNLRSSAINLAEIVGCYLNGGGADVFFQPVHLRCAGMGTIPGFWARIQASAICAGVAFFRSAILLSKSTRA